MAKTPKVKKREVKVNSRAARRGSSPAPKESTATKATTVETEYKPWLHNAQSAGISKKKKTKTLTRQQRARQERGLEKAAAIGGKLEKKVADSTNRGRKVDARRADWEELNEKIAGRKAKREGKVKAVKSDAIEAVMPMEDGDVMPDVMATSMHAPGPLAGMTTSGVEGGQPSVAEGNEWEDVDEVT